jgi:hypothetical protein
MTLDARTKRPNTDKAYLPLQAVQAIKGKKDTLPSVEK